ncbi:MAG: hypothetical protein WCH32_00905 [Pseudomonadota bacterium]
MTASARLSCRPQHLLAAVVLAVLALAGSAARAQEEKLEPMDKVSEAFVSLFSATCVKYYQSPAKLVDDLTAKELPLLDAQHSGPYLHDGAGKAWLASDGHGEFVVALTETGVCSVFARHAKELDVRLMFITLVTAIKVPDAPMVRVADKRNDTPQGSTHYVAYAQQRQTPGPFARFGLTTTSSEKAAFQALATLSTALKQ